MDKQHEIVHAVPVMFPSLSLVLEMCHFSLKWWRSTACVHYRGHGDARDLLPVPSRLKQQRVCSRGREQKSVMLEIKLPIKAYADATIAVEEDANYDFKTGPSFFKKKRCTRARLNPASVVTLYASYCIVCL